MSICTECGSALEGHGRFCPECGTQRAPAPCPSCGTPGAGGRFCSECGTALTAQSSAPIPPDPQGIPRTPVSERRLTSILFADLVGFTPLSESRDPEDVRELLSRYFARGRTIVQRYGGTVEKFIGDAVMAVWGVPTAQEDDAERAVRAGLELVAMVAELGDEIGAPDLRLRVGITTGEVAVTIGATSEGMVAGDAVNTAARVQARAVPGSVWVDKATRDLATAIDFIDAGEHELKGKAQPVVLHQARSVVGPVGGKPRTDGLEPPFVGRDRQLRLIKELLHGTVDELRPRLALVSGSAGVGKTRLVWEFEKYIDGISDGFAWHRGNCRSFGDGSTFQALSEIVRFRLRAEDGEPASVTIAERLSEFLPDESDREWVGLRLEALIGAAEQSTFAQDDLFAAWTRFLERAGRGGPVILVLEDLQLAEPGLLDFLDHLLTTASQAIFVVGLARPELLERRPELLTNRRVAVLHLEPLPADAIGEIVSGVVDGLTDDLLATLVERAEGIPLYAVETLRALMDRNLIVRDDERYRFAGEGHADLETIGAPASLHALVASRLDALPPDERLVVANASILGISFTREALQALGGKNGDLDEVVTRLVRRDVLTVQTDRFAPDHGQLRFVQSVVRHVAYETLSRRDRRAAHLAAAQHLEGEEAHGQLEPVIAHHLLDAVEASGADEEVAALVTKAVTLLLAAAEHALGLGAPDEALRHLALADEHTVDPDQRLNVREALVHAALQGGHLDMCIATAEELLAELEPEQTGRAIRVAAAAGRAYVDAHRMAEAIALLEPRLEALGEGDAAAEASLGFVAVLSSAHFFLGHFEEASRYSERHLELAERVGDVPHVAIALMELAIDWSRLGRLRGAAVLMAGAVDHARRVGQPGLLVRLLLNQSSILIPTDLASALQVSAEAVTLGVRASAGYRLYAQINRIIALYLAGSWSEARDLLATARDERATSNALEDALAQWLEHPCTGDVTPGHPEAAATADLTYRAWGLAQQVTVARARKDRDAMVQASAACFEAAVAAFHISDDFPVIWPHLVLASLEAGALDQAADQIAFVALTAPGHVPALLGGQLRRMQGLLANARGEDPEPDLRAAISSLDAYGARAEAARTRHALGEWLTARGRQDDASELLSAAHAVYEDLGAARWIAELDSSGVAASAR